MTARIHRRALARFTELRKALDTVDRTLEDALRMCQSIDTKKPKPDDWRVPAPDELTGLAKRAHAPVRGLVAAARRWKGDLLTRSWRG